MIKKSIIMSSLVMLFTGCIFLPEKASEEELNSALDNATFDHSIISDFDQFEDFKDFLKENLDTLHSFRNAGNMVTIRGKNGQPEKIARHEECYHFSYAVLKADANRVPEHLIEELKNIWNRAGKEGSFTICKNGVIRISPKWVNLGGGLFIDHELIWNHDLHEDRAYSLHKDSTLSSDCIYRIGLLEMYGH